MTNPGWGIENHFKKVLHKIDLLFYFIIISCNNNSKKVNSEKQTIYGTWLLESLLNYVDSTKKILGHKQFFCSEIIINKNGGIKYGIYRK